jgi:hypothetical protein
MADDKKREHDVEKDKGGRDLGDKGQYGGLERGLGYGGGRDIKDADRPAKDIDFGEDEKRDR